MSSILTLQAMAAAARAAQALVTIQRSLITALILADPPLGALYPDCDLVATILAPTIEAPADAAAIVQLLSADALSIGQAITAATSGQQPGLDTASVSTPSDASAAFYTAATSASTALPAIVSPARGRSAALARMMCAAMEATYLGQAFCMEAQSDFTDRQSALDARMRIGSAMDGASDRIAQTIGGTVFNLLADTAAYATQFIVTQASDLAPVVMVDAGKSFPVTALAYGLYGDPSRAAELVQRNQVATPLFMPAQFEALAPVGGV